MICGTNVPQLGSSSSATSLIPAARNRLAIHRAASSSPAEHGRAVQPGQPLHHFAQRPLVGGRAGRALVEEVGRALPTGYA